MNSQQKYTESLRKAILKEYGDLLNDYEITQVIDLAKISGKEISEVMEKYFIETSLYGVNQIVTKTNLGQLAPNVWNLTIKDYAKSYTAEKAKLITSTMKDEVKKTIQSSNFLKKTKKQEIEKATKEIYKALGDKAKWQAKRIAVTEHTSALNYGRYRAGDILASNGIAAKKQWIAHIGARDCHALAHRQIRDINQAFDVCEPLMFPGDPAGSPEAVINCRCDMIYLIEDNVNMEAERAKYSRAYQKTKKRLEK